MRIRGISATPCWLFALLSLTVGCGRVGPEMGQVSGSITLDGKPVTSGRIQFWPSGGRPARGEIQPDGSYRLTTFADHDGALIGAHVVTIRSTKALQAGPDIGSLEEEMRHFSNPSAERVASGGLEWLVPERYSRREVSGLTAEVVRGENSLDFDLHSSSRR